MPGRGRRIALLLGALALLLSAGRAGSLFVADRLWEAEVSEAAAIVGTRRTLIALGLEGAGLVLAVLWFVGHFALAGRAAFPGRTGAAEERPEWPSRIPRWSVTVVAALIGVLVGGGAGRWANDLLLALDGAPHGIPDPLLGADLGAFVGWYPLLLRLQKAALTLTLVAAIGVAALHAAGGSIRLVDRRLWFSARARAHVALLLSALAVTLAWGWALVPSQLAAGERGPLLPSEFLLRSVVAYTGAGIGTAAAVLTFLWWLRVRGVVAAATWLLLGLGWLGSELFLPSRQVATASDPAWQGIARRMDSVAFQLVGIDPIPPRTSESDSTAARDIVPSLWDLTALEDLFGGSPDSLLAASRGWLETSGTNRPVWYALRAAGAGTALVAVADDEVTPAGGPLGWSPADSLPSPGLPVWRGIAAAAVRPLAAGVVTGGEPGVALGGLVRRVTLAWALQSRRILAAPAGSRVAWRRDPTDRLRVAAPFADWTPARPRVVDGRLLWLSDGLLSAARFPSSARVPWRTGSVAMLRISFLGVVDAERGSLRVFRRDSSDSLAAAWGRIAEPLVEPPEAAPPALLAGDPYPQEFLLAQARVLAATAWTAGQLDRAGTGGLGTLPPAGPGGTTAVAAFVDTVAREVRRLLVARRTASGDRLFLATVDSAGAIEPATVLAQRWERFPFQQQLRDSIRAAGADLAPGGVRYLQVREGFAAYQPGYAVTPDGRVQLVLVSVAIGRRWGAGRSLAEAWANLRGEVSPVATGAGASAVLLQARRWMRHADSALRRGDLRELSRALEYLRELLDPPGQRP